MGSNTAIDIGMTLLSSIKNLHEFVPMVSYELHVTYFYLHDLSSCIVPNNRSNDIDSNDIKMSISPFSPFSTFLGLFRRLLQPFSTFCFLCFAPKLRRRKVNVESSRPYPRNHRRPKNKTSVG